MQLIKLNSQSKKAHFVEYTADEIRLLWNNIGLSVNLKYSVKDIRPIFPVDTILLMIYTGVRPSELLLIENENVNIEERYMVGGIKTAQSENRIIPIHDDIFPLVKARYDEGGKYLIKYKTDNPPTYFQYRKYMFNPVVQALNLDHLPEDGRRTFSTFAERSGMDPDTTRLIKGNVSKTIAKILHTDKTAQELVYAVNQIKFTK